MSDSLQNSLPIVSGAVFGLALLLFLVSLRLFRRSRTDTYWRRRRDAGQRGWRVFLVAVVLFVFSGISCTATVVMAVFFSDSDEATPSASVTENDEPPPSITPAPENGESNTNVSPDVPPTPSFTPVELRESPVVIETTSTPVILIVTSTPGATPTETPFPTFTPHIAPPESSVTPNPGAEIRITALDDQISDDMLPVNPRGTFAPGTTRIYLFVEFSNMTQGVLWKRILYREGEPIDGGAYLWGLETDGTGYFFFGNTDGFPPGNYEIRLFLGESATPINIADFTIAEPS